jgi:hypothetical protein
MRCANLTDTWAALRDWLDLRNVMVLPPLSANLPLARLDADCTGGPGDLDRMVECLHALIEHFGIRAVYVGRVDIIRTNGGPDPELAVLTVRAPAGGVVHELKLYASWYVEFLELTVSAEFAPTLAQ